MFCSKCGAKNPEGANYCRSCGFMMNFVGARPAAMDQSSELKYILPLGRSGLAIAAGYMGLVSVLGVPGPLALLLGILALKDIKKNPDKMGKGRAIFGIVMGIIGTAILIYFIYSLRHPGGGCP